MQEYSFINSNIFIRSKYDWKILIHIFGCMERKYFSMEFISYQAQYLIIKLIFRGDGMKVIYMIYRLSIHLSSVCFSLIDEYLNQWIATTDFHLWEENFKRDPNSENIYVLYKYIYFQICESTTKIQ